MVQEFRPGHSSQWNSHLGAQCGWRGYLLLKSFKKTVSTSLFKRIKSSPSIANNSTWFYRDHLLYCFMNEKSEAQHQGYKLIPKQHFFLKMRLLMLVLLCILKLSITKRFEHIFFMRTPKFNALVMLVHWHLFNFMFKFPLKSWNKPQLTRKRWW